MFSCGVEFGFVMTRPGTWPPDTQVPDGGGGSFFLFENHRRDLENGENNKLIGRSEKINAGLPELHRSRAENIQISHALHVASASKFTAAFSLIFVSYRIR